MIIMATVRMMKRTDTDEMSIMIKTSLVVHCHLSIFTRLLSLNGEFLSVRGSDVVFSLGFIFVDELFKRVLSLNERVDLRELTLVTFVIETSVDSSFVSLISLDTNNIAGSSVIGMCWLNITVSNASLTKSTFKIMFLSLHKSLILPPKRGNLD